ncbi:MAG: polysaccharide biosynthesis protein [Deltaproteobacteria bacterium]|nr:MAG: polysaccharide biosynthesis protein [Deltaproteobacteria bacterium]
MEVMLTETRAVGSGHEPYVIAEIGANHNGDMDLARDLMRAAHECGADAVKFQSWTPDSLVSNGEYERNQQYTDSPHKHFGSLREMVERYYLREDQHFELKEYADQLGIDFCSTAFSPAEVDLLVRLEVPYLKLASMDINNLPLLRVMARTGKPLVVSTGMATVAEIETGIKTIEAEGNHSIVLLHCISIYPPEFGDIHLRNIGMLEQTFGYPVGFSDHSLGTAIPLAAVALGSCLIEKHFTLSHELPGWDHEISATPDELRTIVHEGRHIFQALGSCRRRVSPAEEEKKKTFRRSLVLCRDLPTGHVLQAEDLLCKRPGTGIRPDELSYVIGRQLKTELRQDDLLSWSDLI